MRKSNNYWNNCMWMWSDAVVNMRVIDGTVVTEGDQLAIGNVGSMYYPVCHTCYKKYCSGEKKLPQRFMKTS